jgi:glycosyltransferase involved in cell wall biosynthesis
MKKKISFVLIERTPYHDVLLKNLNDRDEVDLRVYYLRQKSQKRPWDFQGYGPTSYYCCTYRDYYNVFIRHLIHDRPDMVVIAGIYHPKFILAHVLVKLLNIRFAEWGDVPRLDIKKPFFKRILKSLVSKWIHNNAWAVLSMGQPGLNASLRQGCPENKLRNLPCSVDLGIPQNVDQATKEQADLLKKRWAPGDEIIFLSVGRIAPEKGCEVALKALARAMAKRPKKGAILLIAGEGLGRPELQDLANQLGLGNRVHFLGWCQPEGMKVLYYVSDVQIHPAIWEPFGVAILEAMAWGLPVLASDQTMSAVDRVRPGESGFIHRVGDSAALADHILYFLNDPAQIAIMGTRARQTAEQWPVSRSVQTIIDLVEDCNLPK